MRETAKGAVSTAEQIAEMFSAARARIEPRGGRAVSALSVHEALSFRLAADIEDSVNL